MKHSDWDIWKKKLDELPVNSDEGLSWGAMQTMLDKNMPIAATPLSGGSAMKLIVKKVVSALGYVLPAAAIVAAVTYFALKKPEPAMQHSKKKLRPDVLLSPDSSTHDSITADSDVKVMYQDSVRLSDQIPDWVKSIPGKNVLAAGSSALPKIVANPLYVELAANTTNDDSSEKLQASPLQTEVLEVSNEHQVIDIVSQDISTRHLFIEPDPIRESKSRTKAGRIKTPKVKKTKTAIEGSKGFSYGLETGINVSNGNGTSIYYGAFSSYALNSKLLISTGIRANTRRTLSGSYTHPSYNLNDPDAPLLRTIDSRKISTTDIPLQIEYRLSNNLSIKAGPVLTFQSKQSSAESKLDQIINYADTVYHTKPLNEAMANTQMNQVNAAFSGGIKLRLKKFSLEAGYLRNLSPYKVSSSLGGYQGTYSAFSIGAAYRFK